MLYCRDQRGFCLENNLFFVFSVILFVRNEAQRRNINFTEYKETRKLFYVPNKDISIKINLITYREIVRSHSILTLS
jgi:hypothetical protein